VLSTILLSVISFGSLAILVSLSSGMPLGPRNKLYTVFGDKTLHIFLRVQKALLLLKVIENLSRETLREKKRPPLKYTIILGRDTPPFPLNPKIQPSVG